MITKAKLDIYKKYDGDVDAWTRFGGGKERVIMSDQDWRHIEQLVQRLRLEKSGVAAESFQARTRAMLAGLVGDPMVERLLKEYA